MEEERVLPLSPSFCWITNAESTMKEPLKLEYAVSSNKQYIFYFIYNVRHIDLNFIKYIEEDDEETTKVHKQMNNSAHPVNMVIDIPKSG